VEREVGGSRLRCEGKGGEEGGLVTADRVAGLPSDRGAPGLNGSARDAPTWRRGSSPRRYDRGWGCVMIWSPSSLNCGSEGGWTMRYVGSRVAPARRATENISAKVTFMRSNPKFFNTSSNLLKTKLVEEL
jgi:hypothetical protein